MSIFLIIGLLVLATFALLWVCRVRGAALTLAGAAMLFGATGYALVGRPDLPARPVADRPDPAAPLALDGAREAFFGRFNQVEQWSLMSNGYARRGDTEGAAKIYTSAVREHPRNFALWALYGNALADHAGSLSPAALLAFDRAIELGGDAEGPRFFKALAQVRSGDGEAAIPALERLTREAPAGSDRQQLALGALAVARGQVERQAAS